MHNKCPLKPFLTLMLAFGVIAAMSPLAVAVPIPPTVSLQIDGEGFELTAEDFFIVDEGGEVPVSPLASVANENGEQQQEDVLWSIRDGVTFQTQDPEGGSVDLISGQFKTDPFLIYGISVTDFGAPSVFSFTFILPIVPVPSPTTVFASTSGSVTNGAAAGGVTVTALAPLAVGVPIDGDGVTELQVYTLSSAAPLTNAGHDLGPTTFVPLAPFASGIYGIFNEGPAPGPAGGPWTDIRVDVNFSLSGGGDTFTLNGAKVLTPVPEPSTVVLMLAGFLGLGVAAWRRKRQK
jgi:hypothetical protein